MSINTISAITYQSKISRLSVFWLFLLTGKNFSKTASLLLYRSIIFKGQASKDMLIIKAGSLRYATLKHPEKPNNCL